MGALIPTGPDQDICASLTQRFSDQPDRVADPTGATSYIDVVRNHHNNKERLFDSNHSLHRVTWRLGGLPQDPQARLRWYYFLRKILPHQTRDAIKHVLTKVMQNRTIVRCEFYVQYVSGITLPYELYPANSGNPDMHGNVCHLTLQCQTDDLLPNPINEPHPPTPDNNEQPPAQLP